MPRIRSVHPALCDDEVMAEASASAERTFVRLWTHLDDKGRGTDNAKLWKGKLYPLHDDVTAVDVEADLCELADLGLIVRYGVDGRRWLSAKGEAWAKWQRPQHPTPSKIPSPPEPSATPPESYASPPVGGVGSGVVEESSGQGVEGESEGEARPPAAHPQGVDNVHPLAARAAARGVS
jgi:hypothetical protein